MIIGEALNRRADLQKRIAQLQDRVSACVLAQEGEEPPESPGEPAGRAGKAATRAGQQAAGAQLAGDVD